LQLLHDLHGCFSYYSYPKRLSTAMLLDWMQTVGERPWDVDGRMTAYRMSQLLSAFQIRPRVQRIGSDNPARGYQLDDFREHWRRHLGLDVPSGETVTPALGPATAEVTEEHPSEIANKDGLCNAVTHLGVNAVSTSVELAVPSTLKPAMDAAESGSQVSLPGKQGGKGQSSKAQSSTAKKQKVTSRKSGENKKPEGNAVLATPALNPATSATRDDATRSRSESKSESKNKDIPLALLVNPRTSQDGFHRLAGLHQKLRLQGHCPDLSMIANMYAPQSLHAALDWVDAHPEWSAPLKYRSALEFVSCFQNKLAQLSPLT
jgi:hypothetical protein